MVRPWLLETQPNPPMVGLSMVFCLWGSSPIWIPHGSRMPIQGAQGSQGVGLTEPKSRNEGFCGALELVEIHRQMGMFEDGVASLTR